MSDPRLDNIRGLQNPIPLKQTKYAHRILSIPINETKYAHRNLPIPLKPTKYAHRMLEILYIVDPRKCDVLRTRAKSTCEIRGSTK